MLARSWLAEGSVLKCLPLLLLVCVAAKGSNGVYYVFSTVPGDLTNPWFFPPQQSGNLLAAHQSYVEDIARDDEGEIIDNRFDKVVERKESFATDGLSSDWDFFVYKTQVDPIPLVRNAELLLIRAEVNIWEGNFDAAIDDRNIIRTEAGLPEYGGPETRDALLDEMLTERHTALLPRG